MADGAAVGTDPLAPAAAPAAAKKPKPRSVHADAILERTKLRYCAGGGGGTPPGWWSVKDDHGQKVAKVWRVRNTARMADLDGAPVLGAVTRLGKKQPGKRSGDVAFGRNVMGIDLLDAGGNVWAHRATFVTTLGITWNFAVDGEKLLKVKIDTGNFTGALKAAVLLDGDKREVGRITEEDAEGTRGNNDFTAWLCLERELGLAPPLRDLVMSMPLALTTFFHRVGGN